MTQTEFKAAEEYMLDCMHDAGYDPEHVYRVLYAAMRIAKTEPKTNTDVVILSALLHDIGRKHEEEAQQPHAETGAQMAHDWLLAQGWPAKTAAHVQSCISTHSTQDSTTPASIEAEILFDADKLDQTGALGTARAVLSAAQEGYPFYQLDKHGQPLPGKRSEAPSLLREYNRKLKKLHKRFYTAEGRQMAAKRQKAAAAYFDALQKEAEALYDKGSAALDAALGKR